MQSTALKLISLNIELDRHLDRVVPFLKEESPDVVCLQEVREKDLPVFRDALQMESDFVALCIPDVERGKGDTLIINEELVKKGPEGIALFTKLPMRSSRSDYYFGNPKEIPRWSVGCNRIFLSVTVEKGGNVYTIGITHFTWTPDGQANPEQRRDMKNLLKILTRFPDTVFCGDFNAPRGGEIWSMLKAHYTDHIPLIYTTSIDPMLHRVKNLERMVDGLWSTPHYSVSGVRLVPGVSDHMAVVGYIERV